MKTHTPPLQPITQADLDYIRNLAAEHSQGLAERCARYRRRATLLRYSLASCIFIACCVSYMSILPSPAYAQITTTSNATNQQVCNIISTINHMLS